VVDSAVPEPRPTLAALLARHGLRLLAIELIVGLFGVVSALPWLLEGRLADLTAVTVSLALSAFAGTFITAWVWSASLAVLSRDLRVGQALRAGLRGDGLRGVLRLWGWLLLAQIVFLPGPLIFLYAETVTPAQISSLSTLLQALSWYVAFATALLPMAVLFEQRGLGRAWLLAHRRLGIAAGIVAVLAVGWGVDRLLDALLSGPVEIAGSFLIGVPLSVLTTVALYVLFLARREEPLPSRPAALG
jgi:hypothetical protein